MAKKKSKQSSSRNTDPRLKSFLRNAEAIIAAEKGLNSESRLKLQTLADHLKLPQEMFDEALTRLQQGIDPSSNLTHYEKAFIKFLDMELEKLTTGIVSPRVEHRAIKMARSRFGINDTRAEQLIKARAEAAGLSLISPLEAEAFGAHSIADRMDGLTTIDNERYSQLYKIGRRWGLDRPQVDQIVAREIARTKSNQKPKLIKKLGLSLLVLLTLAAMVISAAWAGGWIPLRWFERPGTMVKNQSHQSDFPSDTVPTSRFPAVIAERLGELQASYPQLSQTIESITGSDESRQRVGYQQLVRSACSRRDNNQELCLNLTCELFYADPNENSELAVLSSIEDLLSINQTETPSVQNLKTAFQVNKLLGQLKFFEVNNQPENDERRTAVDDTIESLVDISLDSVGSLSEYLMISENAIATDQWNRVMQTASSSPSLAAVLFQPLSELTDSILDAETLDAYRDDILVSIMESDPSCWRVLQTQIRHSLKTCDNAKLMDWVSIFERSSDTGLIDLLADAMLPRIGVQPAGQSRGSIATAVRDFGLEARNQVLRPLVDRNKQVEDFFTKTMEFASGLDAAGISPDRIAQLALAVNVEWAFCASIENTTIIDDSSFAEFDRLIAIPSSRLRELISLPIDRRKYYPTGPSTATASDRRKMNTSLERLADTDSDSSSLRILSIKQLNQIAHRFDRISYSEAKSLASYLLSNLELEELLNVEKLIEAFAHWPNLPLAIADQLPESNVKADQVLTISTLLLNRNFELGVNTDWKHELQLKILMAVSNDVESQIDQDPDNDKSNWIRLKIYLAETYRERLALGSNRGYALDAFPTPHQAAARLVESLTDSTITPNQKTDIRRASQLVHTSPANEVEKTAFANQLLIQTIVAELAYSEEFADAERLLADLRNRLLRPMLAGDQLFATELTLLQVVNLKRKSLIQRLMKQDLQP